MFYNEPNRAYSIIGIYRLTRMGIEKNHVKGRTFSALAFRIRGESQFTVEGKVCLAKEKSLTYIPTGVGYTRIGGNEEMIIIHLRCNGEDDKEIISFQANELYEQIEKICLEWEKGGATQYNRCMSHLYRIFETIEKENQLPISNPPDSIMAGVSYLHAHYRDVNLTVATIASFSNVSEVYFRRIYQKAFGTSPWQTILELRFTHACMLLRSGYYTIKEIATLSGFADVKYFRTAFGKRFGITPTEYAKRNE